ncbi:3-dehydroquinate synthase [Georgenia faecalis]|uniref:3-dehydroquinate synthase n=1 Tax=Georgenia faecalis TaxID=2483799 RepID=A0ABV9DAB8_9MICO|nr:3-dehydroquinate synthase [Georgenia faecalis]
MTATRIEVRAEHPYDVVVGRGLDGEVVSAVGDEPRRVLLVHPEVLTDRAQRLGDDLARHGHAVHHAVVPDAEHAKTVDVAAACWSRLGQAAFTREDLVVGLGGGATTDLAGFVAATWLRGVRVVQVPTTLLGMVDAAVGGKTGINTPEGKNLVGAFHSPVRVVCDLDTLATLPAADHAAGLAEVVKAGFIADERILDLVEADGGRAARDPGSAVLRELVERAIAVKAEVVSADLREAGRREFLNYGHTLAHAIEHAEHYAWRHGAAVSVGMVFAAELAGLAGRLPAGTVARHREILGTLGLPLGYRGDRWPELLEVMHRDKKARGNRLRFVVLDGVGRPGRLEGPDPALLEAAYARIALPA